MDLEVEALPTSSDANEDLANNVYTVDLHVDNGDDAAVQNGDVEPEEHNAALLKDHAAATDSNAEEFPAMDVEFHVEAPEQKLQGENHREGERLSTAQLQLEGSSPMFDVTGIEMIRWDKLLDFC